MARKFRKLPVVIEAVQLLEDQAEAIAAFVDGRPQIVLYTIGLDYERIDHAEIATLEGTMRADRGDWLILGIKGEIYPCKPDIFAATYEPAD